MAIEICSYRLTMQGKPVGSQVISTNIRGYHVFLETKLMLQGALGKGTVRQKSKLHKDKLSSSFFNEETQEGNNKRQFNVSFDYHKGVVRASRSPQDQTEIPLALPYSDPLSLIYNLRRLSTEESFWRIPLLGKTVSVERIAEKTLDTPLGQKEAFIYKLWPGGNYVYIDKERPFLPLLMTQRFDGRSVDSQLIRVSHEAERPSSGKPQNRRQNKNRSNRRRPRRPQKSQNKSQT